MIVTYNWLKDFVDFDLMPEQLADLLTMVGLEVEGMKSVGSDLDDVIVARVVEKAQHPNADKLSLCQVDTGREIVSVVCGAQNFAAGDKVALAQIGAVLPGDFRIKKSKIRGCESFGMLCSEKELGLADESSGIMILPPEFVCGVPVFDALGLKDVIIEIGLTPNRADCLSIIGIAREIAAKLGKKLSYPKISLAEGDCSIANLATIRVDDPELCPRYTARYISGCTVAPSPQWLVNRLASVGVRSINNVVDVTNYVLHEYGHPLHAFDYNQLAEHTIIVRRASEGEVFTTLDGQKRVLTSNDLTIRDGNKAVALAGIMGGENSEICPSTSEILLESACFSPTAIRRTSKTQGMHTESSHRFERGADIAILPTALDRAAAMIAELSGGCVAAGAIDVYPDPVGPRTVSVSCARVAQVLGISISRDQIRRILESLEFSVTDLTDDALSVVIPQFRVDIEREIDLIEEVARLYGYDNIPGTMPQVESFVEKPSQRQQLERAIRDVLVSQGLSEVITYSFINPTCYEKVLFPDCDPRRACINVLNPLSEDQSVMRTSLLPGLLEVASRNTSFRTLDLHVYEVGRVYLPSEKELPDEPLYVGGILSGLLTPDSWCSGKEQTDFYDVKGVLENVFDRLGVCGITFEKRDIEPYYHPGKACSLVHGQNRIGSFGELHPTIQENYSLERPAYYFELNCDILASTVTDKRSVVPPPRFPDVSRDIAMLVPEELATGSIIDSIADSRIKEIERVDVFDVYTGSTIPAGHKSVAVRVRYRAHDRTLTDEEVSRYHQRVIDNLLKKINVSIR